MNQLHIVAKILVLSFLLSSCKMDQVFSPKSPYDKYKASLIDTDLKNTALAKDWITAGETAFKDSIIVELPYEEIIKFKPSEPSAVLLKYKVKEGQTIEIIINSISNNNATPFINIFENQNNEFKNLNEEIENDTLTYKVKKSAEHAIRIQPELLRGGIYQINIRYSSSLAFPLQEKNFKNISSFFGDGRDAGARKHEGIDIFADRGTPVTAVSDGTIRRVGNNTLGGKIIFLSGGGYSYYYAHLDSQLVQTGQRVKVGDTLGLVGNTGNAITTAPHLHFGIYSFGKGALNPFDFLAISDPNNQLALSDTFSLNQFYRVINSKINLRANASTESDIISQLNKNEVVRVDAALKNWFRISLPDGTKAYVYKNLVTVAKIPLETIRLDSADKIKDQFKTDIYYPANIMESEADLLGTFKNHAIIKFSNGDTAWLKSNKELKTKI